MKIALIGAGGMAASHFEAYKRIPEAEVIAVVDSCPQRASEIAGYYHAEVYTDIDHMLAACKPDIADICVPSFLHYEYSVKCMKKGIHTFCEKPMAHTLEDAEKMMTVAKECGVRLMIGQVLRFWPEYEYLKKFHDEMPFGKVKYFSMSRYYGAHPTGSWYMDPEKCRMNCFEMHIHDSDFVNYLLGLPDYVSSVGHELPGIHMSYIQTRYCYEGKDIVVVAEGGWNDSNYPFNYSFRAVAEHGVLALENDRLMLYPGQGPERLITPEQQPGIPSNILGVFKELSEFIRCIKEDKPSDVLTLESTYNTIKLVSCELQSVKSGTPVAVA